MVRNRLEGGGGVGGGFGLHWRPMSVRDTGKEHQERASRRLRSIRRFRRTKLQAVNLYQKGIADFLDPVRTGGFPHGSQVCLHHPVRLLPYFPARAVPAAASHSASHASCASLEVCFTG